MKAKTTKSLAKRLRRTGGGKLMHLKMSSQHLARRKSKRARGQAKETTEVSKGDERLLSRYLPYL